MSNKIFALDPGHGGKDPGASGNGLVEKDLTLEISNRVNRYINGRYEGVSVFQTRQGDYFVPLQSRTDQANNHDSDCLVSVHINSAADERANGFESFVYTSDGPDSKSVALQNILHKRIAPLWVARKSRNRGTKKANFHMVREFNGASVLLELGFIVNDVDARLLKSDNFLEALAEGVGDGVAEYLRLKPKDKNSNDNNGTGAVYRIIVDGTQQAAYAQVDNMADHVERAINDKCKRIEIELV